MRIYLCSDFQSLIKQSGIGRAMLHQQMALDEQRIPYTTTGEEPYDIIHINTIFPQSHLKAKRARRAGKAVIYHAHSTIEDFRNSYFFANTLAPLFGWWLKKCYQSADLLLTPSDYSKSLIEAYRLEVPIAVISNGIDLTYWRSSEQEQKQFRETYAISPDDKLIISVGHQIKRKGILDFVAMAKALPDYQFIWFGYTDKKLLSKEIVQAVETDLPNLQFPGYIERDSLRVAYQACDLYVFLTHEETEGIVLLEALASKTPTLVRDIPVFNFYKAGETLYKGQTLNDFICYTQKILQGECPPLVENAYKKVSEKSIQRVGEELRKNYLRVLSIKKESTESV
ncbi:glycosyltransferase family 4 protein [Jeotgalibaca dankookensis]|uniref:glycosyltransferase family 4 protein n=1 Tax=Jeotgalibaca dankookensis TaxID=708126 RepID=UPI00078338B2|nr:glycosyltransferase family 4 protein [Jeotgalibaca dankookensis]